MSEPENELKSSLDTTLTPETLSPERKPLPAKLRIFLSLLIVGILLIALYWHSTRPAPSENNPILFPSPTLQLGLAPYLDSFENLTPENLPNFSDIRGVFPYQDRLIVMGAYLIMEYDPETDTIYRLSTEPLSCATSAAMVDNNLYIACHEVAGESSKIYKVNLESGEIIARYNDVELTGQSRVNLKLLSQDNWLWGASDEGIFRIDTKTTRIDTYNHAALQMPVECLHPAHIYFEYDQLKVLYQNCDRVSAYQAESDTWVLTDEVGELPTKINLSEKDFGLDLPYFMGYTRIVENKRYLFADSGLYVTTASTLPKKIFSWEIANPPDSINPEAYVTPDGALALFIGQAYDLWYLDPSKTPTLEESLFLYLVDLTTGESTNLVPIHPQAKTPIETISVPNFLEPLTYEERDGKVIVKGKEFSTVLLTVDLTQKNFELNLAPPTNQPSSAP